jgi:hypothetical protein
VKRLAILSLFLAACGSSTAQLGVGFDGPSDVVVFRGRAEKNPGVHPYMAVANGRRGDLTLVDAVDLGPVRAPAIVRSLVVPVGEHPWRLASRDLADGAAGAPTPDLLVVADAAAATLHLVSTWDVPRATAEIPLGVDAEILSIIAIPIAPAPGQATPGAVRVVAGLTGGAIATLDFERQPDGSIAPAASGVAVRQLGFDAVSFALSADLTKLYAATPDPIPSAAGGSVLGVAELDVSGDPAAWPVRAIPTIAGTRLVATWRLRERVPGTIDTFAATAVDRVYVSLDPASCGADRPIQCGVAVVDPVAGERRVNPAAELPAGGPPPDEPYLAPIRIPGTAVAMAVATPPAVAPSPTEPNVSGEYLKLAPGTGGRQTTGVLAVASSDGSVYPIDLARWHIPTDTSVIASSSRTRIQSGATIPAATGPLVGVWAPSADGSMVVTPAELLAPGLLLGPGYTPDEGWTVLWQGMLPSLVERVGSAGRTGDGATWVAVQAPRLDEGGVRRFDAVARLYDPTLGVHVGDFVHVRAPASFTACPAAGVESVVTELLRPDPSAYPGGALRLAPSADAPTQACLDALAAGTETLFVTVRASGFVLAGQSLGYAGRPALVTAPPAAGSPQFRLQHEPEEPLVCPLVPWPADPAAVDCPDGSLCRETCERLVLARKARRSYRVSDTCANVAESFQVECTTSWSHVVLPDGPAPAVGFSVGLHGTDAETGIPARGSGFAFRTASGVQLAARRSVQVGGAAAVMPTGIAAFDRSVWPGKEADGYRFFVSYVGDYVLDLTPSLPGNVTVVVR